MSLIQQAIQDVKSITSDLSEWGVSITLTAPDNTVLNTTGLHTKHSMGYDTEGRPIQTKNTHISISESNFIDAGYPYRDAAGEVNLLGHLVVVADSEGIDKTYVIRENMPDETIGLIVCILGDFE